MHSLGQRIYYARVHRGRQSMAAFGAAVARAEGRQSPYSPQAVSEWEHDRRTPSLPTLAAIATTAHLRVEWLAFAIGTPPLAA